MEKNQNTPNGDELCIKYVMNELDPSEIYMIRREMEEDEDLLIEIECLSRAWGKVKNLPYIPPPNQVTEAVVQQAGRQYQLNHDSFSVGNCNNTTLMACAAAVIFTISIGVANFYPQLVGITAAGGGAENIGAVEDQIEPWVDNNDILHLNTSEAGFSLSVQDSLFNGEKPSIPILNADRESQAENNFQLIRNQFP